MARKPRVELAGGIHHVVARGNNRQVIYRDDHDRAMYFTLLRLTIARTGWHCLAYCLMDNHVHLLVETPSTNLGSGMQRLHGLYARSFNDRHRRVGHVFQGRFKSKPMTDDEQMWTTTRYIARNPVEARCCHSPREWSWSSHAAMVRGTAPGWLDAQRLLSYFGGVGGDPLVVYRALVEDDPG
jgi:REP element-mobilizing transposase RayT